MNLELVKRLKEEVSKIVIGKEGIVDLFTVALLHNGHILLESVPGTGKTVLAKTFAKAIDGSFKRIQFTPDVLPSDITGIQFFNPKVQQFELRPGPVLTNVLLADEINRATPRTQSSLLEVMEERQVTIDGETLSIERPFMVIATQNPVESQQGTFPLPTAQMDRFFLKLQMLYPSFSEEKQMLHTHKNQEPLKLVEKVFNKEEILSLQEKVKNVSILDVVENYLLEITRATREHDDIELGVSPRGTLALMKAAQGMAFLDGRDYIKPDDIKKVAVPVLSHRILLSAESSLTKTPEQVIEMIVETVKAPVEAEAR